MSIFKRSSDCLARWSVRVLLVVAASYGEGQAIASPPEIESGSPGCLPIDDRVPLPVVRADNTLEQLLARIYDIERIEIFDPVERRVIATLTGRMKGEFVQPIDWFAAIPETELPATQRHLGPVSRWRTVLLFYPKDHSDPFLAHPLNEWVIRLQGERPYERGDVSDGWRDPKTDLLVGTYQMARLTDAFESVRPLSHFCPATIRMPDCAVEQARWANEPVQPPRIRPNNSAKQLIASKNQITRIKIWSAPHRGVIGELDETEVADLTKQLGQATRPRNEWSGSPGMWNAALLVYTRGSELPFAVHVMDEFSLRVSHSDVVVDHDLLDILPRYLGPEDPFWKLEHERQREVQRRCHLHSDIGDDPFPHLPMARIEPVDP
jgi:hypothetical protein